MQDIYSIGAFSERLFGGGDRRLRPHNQNNAVKCPRCESLNTKFCYYNNYNLSQPRHFCKTCRRYWTNGGVLRNVPVGGGCRNIKCSKPKKSSSKIKTIREGKSNSNSSSENSSLTEYTPVTENITDEASGSKIISDLSLFNFSDSRFFVPDNRNTIFEQNSLGGTIFEQNSLERTIFEQNSLEGTIFSELRTFRSLITATNDELAAGFLDQTVHIDFPRSNKEDEFTPLDWRADHEELFEFTGTVDQSYWSQNQWSDHDHDHSQYLP